MGNRFSNRQRRAAYAGLLAVVLAMSAGMGAAFAQDDDDEDVPLDTKILRRFMKEMGFKRSEDVGVDYRERRWWYRQAATCRRRKAKVPWRATRIGRRIPMLHAATRPLQRKRRSSGVRPMPLRTKPGRCGRTSWRKVPVAPQPAA
jgi:hypothetical protein